MIISAADKLQYIQEYYFSRKLKEIKALMEAGKDILNLGIGNPDQMPSTETIEALKSSADKSNSHGYQSYIGIPSLRKAMAKWYLETYQVELNFETEILPLLGSKEGITHITQAFINPGDKVLIPNPGYPSYESATRLAGGIPVFYELDETNNWAPDFSAIKKEDLEGAKLLWVNYPNMPTGAAGSISMLEQIIQFAKTNKLLVINDNPYSLILNEERPLSIFQVEDAKSVALELNSLSKSHNMAGWRIGLLTGRADYISTVLKVKSNVDSGMFLPMQEAAVKAFENTDDWHNERNEVYVKRRLIATSIMEALNCVVDANQVGMFLWAKIEDKWEDSGELADKILYEANVFITPGFIFGTKGKRFLRISLCSPETMLSEALKRIKSLSL
jgi:LL-diaminopimelate aminotransferase